MEAWPTLAELRQQALVLAVVEGRGWMALPSAEDSLSSRRPPVHPRHACPGWRMQRARTLGSGWCVEDRGQRVMAAVSVAAIVMLLLYGLYSVLRPTSYDQDEEDEPLMQQ
jgi:hypothetical protein